jgi:hypothetical protein
VSSYSVRKACDGDLLAVVRPCERSAWTTGTLSFAVFGVWLSGGFVVHGWRTGAFSAPSAEEDERAAAERLKAEYRHD